MGSGWLWRQWNLPGDGSSGMTAARPGRRLIIALALAGALGIACGWTSWQYPLPDPRAEVPAVRLYAGGEELAVLQGTSREAQSWVPLARIPRSVVDAVLAAEDRRFFHHGGIDFLAVLRAVATDLRHREVRQGASTITQQLARSLFLTPERTWWRKLREAAIALLLELRYPKERILEAYLNTVYLGQDGDVAVYGVGAAAQHFLRKDLAAVRLDEAALLAAAIRAPNKTFSEDPARTRVARDAVLRRMAAQAKITEAALRAAMSQPIPRPGAALLRAPYFVDLARDEIARRVALPSAGEIRIQTSLDLSLQRSAERAIRDGLQRIERRRPRLERRKLQGALVALEPASGRVRALIGGRGYPDSPLNRAVRTARQPGSLFKPIVYLAAFEAGPTEASPGLTPASLVPDELTVIRAGGRRWTPHNFDRTFHGPVTVRRALEESMNVPAVRVAQEVGLEAVARTARALGIESPLDTVPSLALGTSEVTLLEITAAFATLANLGLRVPPTTLAEEQSPATRDLVAPPPPPELAVSAESSFLITHLLRGVMSQGTARASARWGLSDVAAGKTGTTSGLRDAWFVGYTPDLAVGVWVGMDDGSPLGLTGAQAALPIWAAVMQAAVRRAPPGPFTPPPGVVFASIDRETGRSASFWCGGGDVIEEAFRAGTEPQADCAGGPLAAGAQGVLDWIRDLFR